MSERPVTPLLELEGINAGYARADVLHAVDLQVREHEVVCIIGPNGAGKSTVFNVIYGFVPVRAGRIRFRGEDVTGSSPRRMLHRGITIVPQQRSLFPQMTVVENLELGMYLVRDRRRVQERIAYVLDLFPDLAPRVKQLVGTMSGGEQRMIEIGRALMWEPQLLLMDEPSAGLAPKISAAVLDTVLRLNQQLGIAVLLIEQNARQGLRVSHRGFVMELGRVTYSDTGAELLKDPKVQRAFLGGLGDRDGSSGAVRG
jgi:ABC-type branched-subunit amino acid transport system ATPase component